MQNTRTSPTPRTALLLASALALSPLLAQQHRVQHSCGFDRHHQQRLLTDPGYAQRVAAFEQQLPTFDMGARSTGALFVPVVVHVLETGTAITAITDDQVRDGIRWLNERWRKVPGTAGDGNGVDTQIEFALAVRDPQGNCTSGITRHDMTGNATYMASGVFDDVAGITDAQVKAIGTWDQSTYYNIWLVSEFDNNNGGAGTQGYAYFSSSHGQAEDGTVMLVNSYKDPTSITLAHEMGHAFNLYHTFEGDANGTICPPNATCGTQGDRVCDTPPHIRSNSDCDLAGTNACDGNSSNALFKHNYLDYSGDACQNEFTAGQNTRIQAALTVDRASFLAVNGNMALVPPAAPQLDMEAASTLLCGAGSSVQLFDRSSCIPNTHLTDPGLPGTTFAWTITNGVNTYNSNAQNPVFTLGSIGVYNVTLSVTNGQGTFSRTENGMVVVVAAPMAACTPTTNNAGNYAQTVNHVVFHGIDNTTSTTTNTAYTDLACAHNTVVVPGATYPLAVTIRAGGSAAESLNGYIDYNNNGVFEDPAELVISGSTPVNTTATINANITIPGGAVTNTLLRMRLYGEAGTLSANERNCVSATFIGDVEDYGVYVSNNVAGVSIAAAPGTTITYGTNVTFTPTPVNGGASPTYTWYRNGTDVGNGATYAANDLLPGETVHCAMFSSQAGVLASPALSNTLTMTVTGAPLSDFTADRTGVCAGGTVTFDDLSLLGPTSWSWSFPGGTPATSTVQDPTVTYATPGTYAVTLTASNANGTGSTMTKTAYITVYATPPAGCTVTRTETPAVDIGIWKVAFHTIDHATAWDGPVMNDYSCTQIAQLEAGTNYPIAVTVGAFNNQWVRVYIDYNGNGVFTDAGEQVFAPANGTGVRSGSFTTPPAPATGVLRRMRVISDFVNTTPGSCTSPLQYGQVEDYGVVFTPAPGVAVAPRVRLEGPYNATTGLMGDGLRSAGLVPLAEPYTALGYSFAGGGGGESTTAPVLAVTGSNAIVDWVVVELRSDATPTTVLASKAALLQRDGDVVGMDGSSAVSFSQSAGTYRLAIRHRNHLPAMTLNGVALSNAPTTVDLTVGSTATYGTDARKSITGAFPTLALWAGDVTFNGQVKYAGGSNDRDPILVRIGGGVPTNTVNGYHPEDVNLNGQVKYAGGSNDRDPILVNLGGSVPTATRNAQLP
ncbi:MAG: PKD domain-containing protein [Flavobacteriales bacterium]|nr:hypothetical protein [Flavobacteriales bacterium]MCC6578481.1 PKD domain-containing protein [Flavobacteriales bacterium]NUQ13901.1 PKD domain-containing protein [Flavobacteriales bacterium]